MVDTAAKRYSAMNHASPWRGTNVVPDVTFPIGERQAALYMYYGIDSNPSSSAGNDGKQFLGEIQSIGIGSILDSSMGVV